MKAISNDEVKQLSVAFAEAAAAGDAAAAIEKLEPLLNSKCPFPKLDLLGKYIGAEAMHDHDGFLRAFDQIVDYQAMGGYVVVGQALVAFLETDFARAMQKSREYIVKGDRWYVCDIIGERSLGSATVEHFDEALPFLKEFLEDGNRWVRRSAGVAVHFFAKSVLDDPEKAQRLLELLEPYIAERQFDAVKGIGWGLKTLGKTYPQFVVPFLEKYLQNKKHMSKLMLRKALTYLRSEQRKEIERHL